MMIYCSNISLPARFSPVSSLSWPYPGDEGSVGSYPDPTVKDDEAATYRVRVPERCVKMLGLSKDGDRVV
jgi:hypothetical protein